MDEDSGEVSKTGNTGATLWTSVWSTLSSVVTPCALQVWHANTFLWNTGTLGFKRRVVPRLHLEPVHRLSSFLRSFGFLRDKYLLIPCGRKGRFEWISRDGLWLFEPAVRSPFLP